MQVQQKNRVRVLALCVVCVAALTGTWAVAEPASENSQTLASEIEDLEGQVAGLSGEEKLEQSVKKIENMKSVLTSTSGLLERVREDEQDILKLNCINEKTAAIKGFLKVGEQAYGNLKDSVKSSDTEAANHHFTLIAIGQQKVRELGDDAQVCAGETLRYSGDLRREVTVDPEISDLNPVDPKGDRYSDDYISQRLPELTPYQ